MGRPVTGERDRLTAALERLAQLEKRQQAADAAGQAPIAVIGLACRFPGGANSPDAYWQMLLDGTDAVGPIPKDRWDADAMYALNHEEPGTIATRHGAFLTDIDRFDARFFDILRREAIAMDPQQRLLLEVAWEALSPPDIRRRERMAVRSASSWELPATTTASSHPDASTTPTPGWARPSVRPPVASPMRSVSTGPVLPSMPRVRHRWRPCTLRVRHCATTSVTWRWPAA